MRKLKSAEKITADALEFAKAHHGDSAGDVVLVEAILALLAALAWLGIGEEQQEDLYQRLNQEQRDLLFEEDL